MEIYENSCWNDSSSEKRQPLLLRCRISVTAVIDHYLKRIYAAVKQTAAVQHCKEPDLNTTRLQCIAAKTQCIWNNKQKHMHFQTSQNKSQVSQITEAFQVLIMKTI